MVFIKTIDHFLSPTVASGNTLSFLFLLTVQNKMKIGQKGVNK